MQLNLVLRVSNIMLLTTNAPIPERQCLRDLRAPQNEGREDTWQPRGFRSPSLALGQGA